MEEGAKREEGSCLDELVGLFGELSVFEDEEEVDEDVLLRDKFEERLQTNPHFFLGWFGDEFSRMGEEEALQFLESLFSVNTKRPRTKAQMEKLEFNASKSYEVILYFFVEAFVIAGVKRRFAAKAFQLNEMGKSYAIDLVAQGMSPEYLTGVRYLHRWGQLYVSILKGKLPRCDPSSYDGVEEFQKLSNKSKAFVLGAKVSVMSARRKGCANYVPGETLNILREIVELDPTCYEWHYHLGNWLRQARRREGGWSTVSKDEEKTLWETYEKCDYVKMEGGRNSRLRNKALAGVLQAIAENLRFRQRQGSSDPVRFGDLEFPTDAEAAAFIVKEINRMMREEREDNGKPSFSELIRAGEMLSSLLPFDFRDVETAEKYYLEAMALKPKNSKLNHKLGLLYLTSPKMRNIPLSVKHLRLAWEIEQTNIPSGIDLTKTLMINANENRDEINKIVSYLLNSNRITPSDRRQIVFILGCFHFAVDEKIEAMRLWVESEKAIAMDNSTFPFHGNSLGASVKRYQWDAAKFAYGEILAAAEAYEKLSFDSLSPADFEALKKIKNSPSFRVRNFDPSSGGQGDDTSRGRGRTAWRGGRGEGNNWRGGRGEGSNWRGGRGEGNSWRGGRGEGNNWRGGRGEGSNWRGGRGEGNNWRGGRGEGNSWRGGRVESNGDLGIFRGCGGGGRGYQGGREREGVQNWRVRDGNSEKKVEIPQAEQ